MSAIAVPLAADKLEAWQAWANELVGSRRAEFEDLNERHGITEHRAYLQQNPDGSYLVLAVQEGPGAESFLPNVMASDHEFDRYFVSKISELHGLDPSGPIPPPAPRVV